MEETLKNGLRDGETILWRSKTEAIETLDKTNKKPFWLTLLISAAVFVLLVVLYVLNVSGPQKPVVYIILLVACGFAPVRRLADAREARKLHYIVTDRRLLSISGELRGVELKRVKTAALRTDEDGHLSLLAGADAVKARPSRWRALALTGQPSAAVDDNEPVDRFVFYAVEDRKGLEKVLRQVLPGVTLTR